MSAGKHRYIASLRVNISLGLNSRPLTTGVSQTNVAFGQISAAPETGVPITLGGEFQWSNDGSSVSSGIKPGVGTFIGAGVGRVFTGTVATPPLFSDEDQE